MNSMRDHRHMTSRTSQGSKFRFLKFGSVWFGRFGVRSPEIFSFFDLQHLSSVLPFGFGGSAKGTTEKRLRFLIFLLR
jgi:hypothetical protein